MLCLEDQLHVNIRAEGRRYEVICPECDGELGQTDSGADIFSQRTAMVISLVIVGFFGGFMLLITSLSGASSFVTVFFGVFILIAVLMVNGAFFFMRSMRSRTMSSVFLQSSSPVEHARESTHEFCMHCGTAIKGDERDCLSCGEPLYSAK